MTDRMRVYAGECTTEYEGTVDRTARGHAVALIKPDDTVLVHDRDGYAPVAWLTHPASLDIDHGDGPRITAVDGDQRLTVRFHETQGSAVYPVSVAGVPIGSTAGDAGEFVRSRDTVVDLTTGRRYPLPPHSTVIDARCNACGLPSIRVERTENDRSRCLDPTCEHAD